MKKHIGLLVLIIAFSWLTMSLIASCDDDDDDDNDTDDDDDNDTGDDDDDDTGDLPECEPFAEAARWITWGDLSSMSSEFNDEKDGDNVVNAAVSWSGDTFTIKKGTYQISGTWNRVGIAAPLTEGQSVKVHFSSSAGDDGCCDTEALWIWGESWTLLIYYDWNEKMRPVDLGEGFAFDSASEWTPVCKYVEGRQPPTASLDWDFVTGLSVAGHYQTSQFTVEAPGGSSVSADGLYEVNWPVAYRGELAGEDENRLSHNSVLELIVAVD